MAATGFTPISLYYSATGAAVPTAGNLVAGELALNTNDGKLYFKNSAGVVTLLAGSTSGPAGGSNTQVQYNNSGVLAGITGATTNGTALTLVAPNLGSPSSVGTMPAFTLGGTVSGGGNNINNVVIGASSPLAGSFAAIVGTGAQITGQIKASYAGAGIASNDTTAYSAGVTGGAFQMQGLDSTSTLANLVVLQSLALAGQQAKLSIKLGDTGSVTERFVLSSTALALGVGVSLTGGTSGTGYSFSGSAPAGSLALASSGQIQGVLNNASVGNATSMQLTQNGAGDAAISFLIGATTEWLAGVDNSDSDSFKINNITGGGDFNNAGITLTTGGNLGLGVTPSAWTPTKVLELGGEFLAYSGVTGYLTTNAYYGSLGFTYNGTGFATRYEQTSGKHVWYNAPSGTAGNTISFTQAITLDANGDFFVGQTSGGIQNSYSYQLAADGTLYQSHATGSPSGRPFNYFGYGGTNIGSITQSGTTAVLYNLTSDQRLKENIQDAAPASSLIDAIQVRQFDWKSDGSFQRYGFIAQELVTVAPEAVHQPNNPEEMMGVDYSKLVPMLVKELQSLRARVAQLESKP